MLRRMIVLLMFLLCGLNAQAQSTAWTSGSITYQSGTNCSILGSPRTETMLSSFASWLHYDDFSAPNTGDASYVSLYMSVPGLNCDANSSVAFVPELILPAGASLAISPDMPVRCYFRIRDLPMTQIHGTQLGNMVTDTLRAGPLCPDGQGGGVGSPFLVGSASGSHGGLALGWQYLAVGSVLEIQIPVRFGRPLNGISDKVRFATVSSGEIGTAFPEVPILIGYRPYFSNYQNSDVTATTATVAADLSSFYVGGTAYADYGTTTAYGSTVTIGAVAADGEGYRVSADLVGLNSASTYHWRPRFVTAQGTVTGDDQIVSTTGAATFGLTVNRTGSGHGTVSSNPAGISCGGSCTHSFAQGTAVTLTATPSSRSAFQGWSGGGCSGDGACVVTMSSAQAVTATFLEVLDVSVTLTVVAGGTGAGNVSSNPAGINCGATCSGGFGLGTTVNLTATPAAGSTFAGFSGCLSVIGGTTCSVSMSGPKSVTANFNAAQTFGGIALEVAGLPAGNSATLSISGPGGFSLLRTIPTGTGQSLSDVVTGDYTVTAPSVVVGGTTYNPSPATQTVTVTTASVTAGVNYTAAPASSVALSVNRAGAGSGTVSSNPAGISCGASCSAGFASGATVILNAGADAGSSFAGWSGDCTGTATCTVTMGAARSVTAIFGVTAAGIGAAISANTPQSGSRNKGDSNVPMLAFTLDPTQATNLQSITLQAAGSGNDRLDLTAVKLFVDANGNGRIDVGESAVASGTFSADNGELTLTLSAPLAINPGSNAFIVAADVGTTLAAGALPILAANDRNPDLPAPWPLALLPVQMLGARRLRTPRPALLAAALALLLVSCGGGGGGGGGGGQPQDPAAVTHTYQVSLTQVAASGSPTVTGLPLGGATISVQK